MNNGFTLIELLLVVVIIGIIAALVLPKFGGVKEKAYVSAMKNDLRNLATAQELYFDSNNAYADEADLPITESDKVSILVGDISQTGYTAVASRQGTDVKCGLNRTDTAATPTDWTAGPSIDSGALVCQ